MAYRCVFFKVLSLILFAGTEATYFVTTNGVYDNQYGRYGSYDTISYGRDQLLQFQGVTDVSGLRLDLPLECTRNNTDNDKEQAVQDGSLVFCAGGSFLQINTTKRWLGGDASGIAPKRVDVQHADSHLVSSSFLFRENYLVFADKGTKTIFLYQDTPNVVGVYAHVGVSEGIGELAVDWVNFNIYWTDSIYSWIGLQALPRNIGLIVNNDKQRIVVEKSLKKPSGLAVSPQQRYLFWTDHGEHPRIERSNLKGEDRTTLVWMAVKTPVSIAVDPATSDLYWIDLARATIETCDFQGQGRRVVLQRAGFSLTSLTVFENSVIYTEAEEQNIHAVSKLTGVQSAPDLDLDGDVEGLTVFSKTSQTFSTSACDSHGCDHICIETSEGPECLCDGGFTLSANDKSCMVSPSDAVWKSIVYSDGTNIRAIPVTTFNSHPYLAIEATTLTSGVNVTFLATDSQTNTFFFATGSRIRRKTIGGAEFTVTSASKEITGLVLDTEGRKVLWTVTEEGLIQSSGITTNSKPADLYTGLRAPGDIAIDVKNRRLFWVSTPPPSRIETGGLTGGSVSLLVSTNLAQPQRLTFDPQRNRLYWTEDGQLGSIAADGSGRHTQALTNIPTYIGVAVFKDYLAWTVTTTATTNSVNMSVSVILDNGNIAEPTTFTIPDITMVTDIVVFDADEYKRDTDGCVRDNGGCDQVCLPRDASNACGCKFGFRLLAEKRCISDVVEEDFSLVIDGSDNSIYQVLQDNTVNGVGVLPSNKPTIVRYDWLRRKVVWYDETRRLIMSGFLNGSEERVVIGTEGFTVSGMDVDSSTSNIFYSMTTSSTNQAGYIRVVTHDGSVSRTVVNTTTKPGPILVYPKKGLLLWGENSAIKQADMSGNSVSTLVSSGLSSVSDISLDSDGEILYIADLSGDTIKSFELTTRTTKTLRENTLENPTALATKGDNLFYLSSGRRAIRVLNRLSGAELEPFANVAEFGQLGGLYVYLDGKITANEECSMSNGGCSALCLPTTSGRTCACADGVNLSEGDTHCVNDKMCPADIRNGELTSDCVRYPNSKCGFTCNQGYVKATSSQLTCLSNGQWDTALETLCDKMCPADIRNGELASDCVRYPNSKCGFTCNQGYVKVTSSQLTCLSNGQWDTALETLCDEMCPADVSNGELASDCVRYPNSKCGFTCNQGYVKVTSSQLTCLSNGQWDTALETLCEADQETLDTAVIVGLAVGGAVLVLIVILAICCWKRGACRSQTPGIFPHSMSRDPIVHVTKDEEVYAEIGEINREQDRYTSFRKISPNPIRKQIAQCTEIKNPAYGGYLTPHSLLPLPHPRPPEHTRSESPAPDYDHPHSENEGYLDLRNWSAM